jgi:hypothetical protein
MAYEIRLTGHLLDGRTEDEVLDRLGRVFTTQSRAELQSLITSSTRIKPFEDPMTAKRYSDALEKAGVECRVVEVAAPQTVPATAQSSPPPKPPCVACGQPVALNVSPCGHCGDPYPHSVTGAEVHGQLKPASDFNVLAVTANCRTCGKEVAPTAQSCPHCGQERPAPNAANNLSLLSANLGRLGGGLVALGCLLPIVLIILLLVFSMIGAIFK